MKNLQIGAVGIHITATYHCVHSLPLEVHNSWSIYQPKMEVTSTLAGRAAEPLNGQKEAEKNCLEIHL